MGARDPDGPKEIKTPGKKRAPRETGCRVQVGKGPLRHGMAALGPEELRFHTGRTGRHGKDFSLHIRYEDIRELVADGPRGILSITTDEDGTVVFHLGRHAVHWKQMIDERPNLMVDMGVERTSRVAVVGVGVNDEGLLAELEARVGAFAAADADGLDFLFVGVEHPADLRRLGAWMKRLRPGGALWILSDTESKDVPDHVIATAATGVGLAPGLVITMDRKRTARRFGRPNL